MVYIPSENTEEKAWNGAGLGIKDRFARDAAYQ